MQAPYLQPAKCPCSMVEALHIILLVDGKSANGHDAPSGQDLAVLVPDLMSLLILVKSTLKACCLPHEAHVSLVKEMILVPVGPGQTRLNLLQVSHMACILLKYRIIHIYTFTYSTYIQYVQNTCSTGCYLFKWVMPPTCLSSMSGHLWLACMKLCIEVASLGLLLGTEVPVMTPKGVDFSFFLV